MGAVHSRLGAMSGGLGPVVLFGACDRHNLGDLLFPHLVAECLGCTPVAVTGLVARDLRRWGGHRVQPLEQAVASLAEPFTLVHVGGEILTCSALDAALMLARPEQARRAEASASWVRRIVGGPWPAPYVVGRKRAGERARIVHLAVGGVDLDQAEPALDAAVSVALREADWVSVRDGRTRRALARRGVAAHLIPDTAVLVGELFGARIAAHTARGELADLRQAYPEGWIAVQFSLDFADDASLTAIAAACRRLSVATELPLVLFRAGAAPLHDDLGLYRQLARRVGDWVRLHIFESLDIWDICALIAQSHGFLGSSLHGRIVALAYALPRASIAPHPGRPGKLEAFVETWEVADAPGVTTPDAAAEALLRALSAARETSRSHARQLAQTCREAVAEWVRRQPRPS